MIYCFDIGVVSYTQALQWQKMMAERRIRDEAGDSLIFLEHPPTYTMGRRDSSEDLLVDEQWMADHKMVLVKTDRGGRITYHGPGQLVGYLVFKIKDSVPKLVWKIEEVLLRSLSHYQLEAERDQDHPGLWVGNRKIAALGLHIERGVTTHGFSLNVSCDLRPFQHIVPCGIKGRGVTSLEKEIGWRPSLRDLKQIILGEFSEVFESEISVEGGLPTLPE